MKVLGVIAMTMLFVSTCAARPQADAPGTVLLIDFCNLRVDEIHRRMSGVLTARFEFRITEDGAPSDIKAVADSIVDVSEARACIAGWRFGPELYGKVARATFTWKHEVGWTQLAIEAQGMVQRISISGERCPYC